MKIELPPFILQILKKFQDSGYEIYIVGGAVRDILTKRPVDDWDFTTDATPPEILKIFPDGFYDNVFGTVGISHESSPNPYEITTFRREFDYSDHRRPTKVEWGKTLEEDLQRRDFTINAMAIGRVKGKRVKGESAIKLFYHSPFTFYLIDYYDGQKDLNNKLIGGVGDHNKRFREDALRMMRAVRIAAELGFTIEDKTFEAIKNNSSLINKIAKERVKDELLKILASHNPYEGVVIFRNSGLMEKILPEMETAFGVEQKSPGRHHIYDVGTHSLLSLKNVAEKNNDAIVRLATLIHDIGKPKTFKKQDNGVITFYNHEIISRRIARDIAKRLRFSKKQAEKFYRLVRYHQFTVDEKQTDSSLRRFIRNVGLENVSDMIDLRVGDRLGGGARETSWRLEEFKKRLIEVQKQPFTVHDLKITGHDVMRELGIKPGPIVGMVLNKIYDEVVEKKVENKKEVLVKLLKEL